MEIKEIVTYYLNPESNILEINFRTIEDDEETLRTDHIDYGLVKEYGFELETEHFDFFDEEEDDFLISEAIELDVDGLISFLNEYYLLNPKNMPSPELF